MYRDPPASTEQILHPGKYLHRDYPTAILPPELPEGYRILVSNVLGELGVSIVLEANLGPDHDPAAVEGWDGDRVLLIRSPTGGLLLAWYTTWDTPEDAEEFEAAARKLLASRHPEAVEKVEGEAWYLDEEGVGHVLFRRGRDLLLLEGVEQGTPFDFLETLAEARKETLVLERRPFGSDR
jgi:hypothetical protein